MARQFVAASSHTVLMGSMGVADPQANFSLSLWFNPVAIGVAATLWQADDNSNNNGYSLGISSGNALQANCFNNLPSSKTASSSTTVAANAWQHAGMASISATSMAVYLAGAGKGTNGTNVFTNLCTRMRIGSKSASGFFNGMIAELAIWNANLADADFASLAAGEAPWFVHPEALVGYWPLVHGYSPEIELIKANNGTVTGATVAAHPAINRRGRT